MEKEIKKKFCMYMRASVLDSGPPLSTILGNYGVNTIKFCDEFNLLTKVLPDYFLLKVNVNIFDDYSFSFTVDLPSFSYLLRLVTFKKEIFIKVMGREKISYIDVIDVNDLYLALFFKFGNITKINLKKSIGVLRSMNVFLVSYRKKL